MSSADQIITAAFAHDPDAMQAVMCQLDLPEARDTIIELAAAIQTVTVAFVQERGGSPEGIGAMWAAFLLSEADE